MSNLFDQAARMFAGAAAALVISITFLTAAAGPALVPATTLQVATLSA